MLNPERASYGASDYGFAISQLAQTTLRSEVGKIDLDRTSRSGHTQYPGGDRARQSVRALGVKVLRYEIKNINRRRTVLAAMEKQMRAGRESAR